LGSNWPFSSASCSLFLLRASKQNYKHIPHLGYHTEPNGKDIKDTIFYQVPEFSVTDQSGKELNTKMLSNNIVIANFFLLAAKIFVQP